MHKFFKMVYAIIIMISGINAYNYGTQSGKTDSSGKFFQPFGDNDPIVMHAHVRTTGGLAIPGASVSLTLSGTSTPQYSGTTDTNGDYTFDSVAQGNYHYKIMADNYYTKNVSLALFSNTDRTDTLIAK